MDDTGEIKLVNEDMIVGLSDENYDDFVVLHIDIKIIENFPPIIRVGIYYFGENRISANKVIFKPSNRRYTFDCNNVSDDTTVSNGRVMELYVLALTDESIQMLKDIVENETTTVKCRLSGDGSIDCELMFSSEQRNAIKELYTLYEESGALDNDFSVLRALYPCAIKDFNQDADGQTK